jgi:hypothetical protein
LDDVVIADFELFMNNRIKTSVASGGTALLVKPHLLPYIEILKGDCPGVLWFKIKQEYCGSPFVGGIVYIPPENSPYSNITLFDSLENDLTQFDQTNFTICLLGDFNARSGSISDVPLELDVSTENVPCDIGISTERVSQDKTVNKYGKILVELCKNMGMHIANGRCGKDQNIGSVTCKGVSLVDYIIMSPDLFSNVCGFEVLPFDCLFSDAHCPPCVIAIQDQN